MSVGSGDIMYTTPISKRYSLLPGVYSSVFLYVGCITPYLPGTKLAIFDFNSDDSDANTSEGTKSSVRTTLSPNSSTPPRQNCHMEARPRWGSSSLSRCRGVNTISESALPLHLGHFNASSALNTFGVIDHILTYRLLRYVDTCAMM